MTNPKFWQGILLKLSFKPDKVKRTMAALIYVALEGKTFTADCVPKEITEDTTTAGCAVRLLVKNKKGVGLDFLTCTGWVTSPAESRHGAAVRQWELTPGKRQTAIAWLKANGFAEPETETTPSFAVV
jgi:hypothetical protein